MKKKQAFAGLAYASILLALVLFFNACTKDQSAQINAPGNGQQNVSLYLTDNPSHFYSKVLIDINSVSILVDTCSIDSAGSNNGNGNCIHHNNWGEHHDNDSCGVWEDLGIQSGIYNVLDFRNGLDTLFAQGNVTAGVVKYIKISLGDSNSVVLNDSTIVPLHFHGWFDSTIYIPIGNGFMDHYKSRHSRCWIDFDIGHSIIPFGGGFWLHPFFRCYIMNTTGGIEGMVIPPDAQAVIRAYNNTDTATAIPWINGAFRIKGLREGTYALDIKSTNGYSDTTIENINVVTGKSTKLGVIKLHQ